MAALTTHQKPQPRTRAPREQRRSELIDATFRVIARKGLNAVTLADVADEAGLSRGIVNFHFESKEKLLFAALTELSREYDENWQAELAAAPRAPAARMRAAVTADLSEAVCAPSKLAAWFGFFGAAATRPDYLDLCWARDGTYLDALEGICTELNREGGYGHDPKRAAMAIYAMQEGLWLRLMLGSAEMSRSEALAVALAMLGTLFPRHFSGEGALLDRS